MEENEIKNSLADSTKEYMMFKEDNEEIEIEFETSSTSNVIIFPDLEELKKEVEKCVLSCQCFYWSVMSCNLSYAKTLKQSI